MNELRQDRISGDWVVIAPGRSDRPQQVGNGHGDGAAPSAAASCDFCPGHEDKLPPMVAEYPSDAGPGWSARVISNKYPAFRPDAEAPAPHGDEVALPAFGYQEVIIESPRHEADFTTLTEDERMTVMRAYRDRFSALAAQPGISSVIIFRNHGPGSGASIAHPHSQLTATGMRPNRLQRLDERAHAYFGKHGSCIVCDELAHELAASSRIVEQSPAFVTLVPFAAQFPSEIWIVPTRHQARFDEIGDEGELPLSASAISDALKRLRAVRGTVSYNFAIDSAAPGDGHAPHLHWRLRIAPKIADRGGFELGTNLPVNPSSPEGDAKALRGAAIA